MQKAQSLTANLSTLSPAADLPNRDHTRLLQRNPPAADIWAASAVRATPVHRSRSPAQRCVWRRHAGHDRLTGGGFLELTARDGDEGAHGVESHAHHLRCTTSVDQIDTTAPVIIIPPVLVAATVTCKRLYRVRELMNVDGKGALKRHPLTTTVIRRSSHRFWNHESRSSSTQAR